MDSNSNHTEVEIKRIKRKTLSRQVVDQIIQLLTGGQLKPGDKLPTEMSLMDKLQVSRPVLREALSSLETIGIIHRRTREGTYFSDKIGSQPFSLMLALSAGDMPSIIEARLVLELGMVTLAAQKITDAELGKLEYTIKMMSESNGDYTEFDKEFHRIIVYSASNPVLEGIIDPLLNMFDKIIGGVSSEDRDRNETLRQHIAIYNALKKRDALAAYTAMFQHLNYGGSKLLKKKGRS